MAIIRHPFGTSGGKPVEAFDILGPHGIRARVLSFGAILAAMEVPDRHGKLANVALGFADIHSYIADPMKVGALCGRVANRIARGKFTLQGKEYQLACNNGRNHLHGGPAGFDRVLWQASVDDAENAVTLSRVSPDGEEGYPGNLTTWVTYRILPDGALSISMAAKTDAPTIINLASHAYWNLSGHDSGSILDHELMIAGDKYTAVDDELIPTGEIANVAGTKFDFRSQRPIGLKMPKSGYDLNYVLDGKPGALNVACRLSDEKSGRMLELSTDQPGLQLYTGAGLNPSLIGADGIAYQAFGGVALETQNFPDAINHPHFPSPCLVPGQIYRHNSIFRFLTF